MRMINSSEKISKSGGFSIHFPNEEFLMINTPKNGENFYCAVPYIHSYSASVKSRWINRRLLDVMTQEFKWRSPQYFLHLIQIGKILINNNIADANYVFKIGDTLSHTSLNIEPLIYAKNPKVLYENENFMLAFKPPGFPVQSQGRLHKTSLTYILKNFYLRNCNVYLHPIHRLDKVTSGLVLYAKNSLWARIFTNGLHLCEKYYLAIVKDRFIDAAKIINKSESIQDFISSFMDRVKSNENDESRNSENSSPFSVFSTGNEILVISNIEVVQEGKDLDGKLYCINGESKKSKIALTAMKLIYFNEERKFSMVLCRPFTGRTHQIRLHLKSLGFPIANDSLYSSFSDPQSLIHQENFHHISKIDPINKIKVSFDKDKLTSTGVLPYIADLPSSMDSIERFTYTSDYLSIHIKDDKVNFEYEVADPQKICLYAFQYVFKFRIRKSDIIESSNDNSWDCDSFNESDEFSTSLECQKQILSKIEVAMHSSNSQDVCEMNHKSQCGNIEKYHNLGDLVDSTYKSNNSSFFALSAILSISSIRNSLSSKNETDKDLLYPNNVKFNSDCVRSPGIFPNISEVDKISTESKFDFFFIKNKSFRKPILLSDDMNGQGENNIYCSDYHLTFDCSSLLKSQETLLN